MAANFGSDLSWEARACTVGQHVTFGRSTPDLSFRPVNACWRTNSRMLSNTPATTRPVNLQSAFPEAWESGRAKAARTDTARTKPISHS